MFVCILFIIILHIEKSKIQERCCRVSWGRISKKEVAASGILVQSLSITSLLANTENVICFYYVKVYTIKKKYPVLCSKIGRTPQVVLVVTKPVKHTIMWIQSIHRSKLQFTYKYQVHGLKLRRRQGTVLRK